MNDLSPEEEIANYLTQRLDGEETLRVLRGLPERLQELSAKHRSFTETQRWDEIADLQSENASIITSGATMSDGALRIRKSALVDYTQYINEEVDAVHDFINRCLQESERNFVPRRLKGKDPILNGLLTSVGELHERVKDIAGVVQTIAETTVDRSGPLSGSRSEDSSIVDANTKQCSCEEESESVDVEDIPSMSAEHSELLPYWESQVKDLDRRCADLRNNLSLGSSILDQQQKTIGTEGNQESLHRQIDVNPVGANKTWLGQQPDTWLMDPLMVAACVFLGIMAAQVVG